MQFIKSLILATVIIASTALPSFASEEFSLGGDEGMAAASDAAIASDDGFSADARRDRGRDWRRPRRPVTCYARNITGRTFAARDWNARRAQYNAVRACRSRSFGPIGQSCRAVGCR